MSLYMKISSFHPTITNEISSLCYLLPPFPSLSTVISTPLVSPDSCFFQFTQNYSCSCILVYVLFRNPRWFASNVCCSEITLHSIQVRAQDSFCLLYHSAVSSIIGKLFAQLFIYLTNIN